MCAAQSEFFWVGSNLWEGLLDQLQKRGWPLANRCYLCQMHEESIDHILLHCAKTRTLWALFFTLFRVQWVLPASVKMMLLGWNGSFVGKNRKEVWRVDSLCIFLDSLEGKEQDCIWRWCAVHSKTWEFFYLFILVGDKIVHKRWSFVFSRFHWLGRFSMRVVFFYPSAF